MNLYGLLPVLQTDPGFAAALRAVPDRGAGEVVDVVAPTGVRAPLLVAAAGQRPIVVVTSSGRRADELAAAVRSYLHADHQDDVAVFPSWETLPHERLSPRADTVAHRIAVLRRLAHPVADSPYERPIRILIMPVRALVQPVVAGLGDIEPIALQTGDIADLTEIAQRLTAAAYERVDMVEHRGQFAVRGGILDVFPPTEAHPLRIDFWGDEVTEIRWFSVADQRSLEVAEHGLWAPPCREVLLTEEVRANAAKLRESMPGALDMLDQIAAGIAVEGMESLAPALVDELVPVLGLVDRESLLIIDEPERVRRRAHDLIATTDEFLAAAWSSAAIGADSPIDLSAASFRTLHDEQALAGELGLGWWLLSAFSLNDPEHSDWAANPAPDLDDESAVRTLKINVRDIRPYRGDLERALAEIRALQRSGWRLVLTTEGPGPAKRMVAALNEHDAAAKLIPAIEEEPVAGVVEVTPALAGPGFVADDLKLAVFSDSDLTGRASQGTKDMRKLASRRRNHVDPLQLAAGDYVVHDRHGVGKFVELIQRTVGSGASQATREYLVLEYAPSKRGHPGDKLFVPMDQLEQVTKYVGGESPTLSKMGGADWRKTKASARAHVRQIADELIRLYGARMAAEGFAFSPDTPWQRELEDAFHHVETPDQLTTIDEVKADMEKPVPMDRLILGDVGYGKTEIAIRAAFKAVQDGKQVAVLVPTTLLVQQHIETFADRFAGFPINVAPLSRFQSAKESKATIEGLASGSVDVVIGTHRLLTGHIKFKDLGLMVIDEEQRFGVEHKETLKQLRTNVDVLAMSATPIPRTMEMALTGIRELSTLDTPPEERHPVLTYVGAYNEKQIVAAIRRELIREGQVFFVHNKVESIDTVAARLAELVPDARIAVAHGKMSESQLDAVIRRFWEREIDVLVCTTIIETGLDIANANTLIVERADQFGLSQLHQLRGRVGRGRERAYAYFLYPPEKPLTETAHDRLVTMAAHTDLGAGRAVAMKDLEIRGAGNLLGGEQSGHIAGVGFDLYVRMVNEAMAAFKGESQAEAPEVNVELPVDAHIPESYIGSERLRLEAYKKIAEAGSADALAAVRAELLDRYGVLPPETDALFEVAAFRNLARSVGLNDVIVQGKYVKFAPVELSDSAGLRLKRLYPGSLLKPATRTILVPFPTDAPRGARLAVGAKPLHGAALLKWCSGFVAAIIQGDLAAAADVQASMAV